VIAFRNPLFDGQLRRTIGHGTYGGAELGECLATAVRVIDGDRESWYGAWLSLADRTIAAAEASAAHGHRESARCAFLRASNYYRNAYVFHLEAPLPALVRDAYRRHRDTFQRATTAMIRPPEQLAIPFEDTTLPGYFCAVDETRRPLIISVGGYDSTAEESFFWNGAAALARGYHDDISAFSKTFFDLLRCEKDYLHSTADEGAGEHCVSGNRALFHERVFDWLDMHDAQLSATGAE
jgi:hypothetical protein